MNILTARTREVVHNDRYEDLEQLMHQTRTGCVFVAAYRAYKCLYPDRSFARAKSIWDLIPLSFGDIQENRAFLNNRWDYGLNEIFRKLDIKASRAIMPFDRAKNMGILQTTLLPLVLTDDNYQITISHIPTMIIYNSDEGENSVEHAITYDGSPTSIRDFHFYHEDGWTMQAIIELDRA
jgi:hypothetical protein